MADAAAGVIPPDFILDKAIRQTATALADRGAGSDLVRSLVSRAAAKKLPKEAIAYYVALLSNPDSLRGSEAAVEDILESE